MTFKQPKVIEDLNAAMQHFMEKEAGHYFLFLTSGITCPVHKGPLDLTPDFHIECPGCYETAVSHAI